MVKFESDSSAEKRLHERQDLQPPEAEGSDREGTSSHVKSPEGFFPGIWSSILSFRHGIRDVILLVIPQSVKAVTGLVSSILLARGLGTAGMGQYALITSVSDAIGTFSDLGIGQTAIRFASLAISRDDTSAQMSVLRWAFRMRMILTFFLVAATFLTAPVLATLAWRNTSLTPLIRLALVGSILSALAAVPTVYFQSLKRFGMNATVLSGQAVLVLIGLTVIALFNQWSVFTVILVTVLATGIGALAFIFLIPRSALVPPTGFRAAVRKVGWKFWRTPGVAYAQELDKTSSTRFAFYLLLSTVIVQVTLRLDIWLMGRYLDEDQIGLYSIATRLAMPLSLLLGALNAALWPRVAAITTAHSARQLLRKTFKVSFLLFVFGAVYAVTVPLLAPLLFGPAFGRSVALGQVLSAGYCVAILANPLALVGYSLGLARIYWRTNLVQLAVVIVLLLWLLPTLGAMGAALAFVANAFTGGAIQGVVLWRRAAQLPEGV